MRLGVTIKIDVTKLEKSRFFQGKSGKYCDLTAFIDTEEFSKYGDNGTISQSLSKEERAGGAKLPICGNVKIFYKDESKTGGHGAGDPQQQPQDYESEDIPF